MTLFSKRIFDIFFSSVGLILLSPAFLVIAILIKIDSPGPVFYRQIRVGKDGEEFYIYKFRKMRDDAGSNGPNVTAINDSRLTNFGSFLMKHKLDELPQLWNVFIGDMSLVGPRPELPCFVKLYTDQQMQILKVKPGITDFAAISFIGEGELLSKADDPEKYYVETLMETKLDQNFRYINEMSLKTDLKIIMTTLLKILR